MAAEEFCKSLQLKLHLKLQLKLHLKLQLASAEACS